MLHIYFYLCLSEVWADWKECCIVGENIEFLYSRECHQVKFITFTDNWWGQACNIVDQLQALYNGDSNDFWQNFQFIICKKNPCCIRQYIIGTHALCQIWGFDAIYTSGMTVNKHQVHWISYRNIMGYFEQGVSYELSIRHISTISINFYSFHWRQGTGKSTNVYKFHGGGRGQETWVFFRAQALHQPRRTWHAGSGAGCVMYTLEGMKQSRWKPWTSVKNSQRTS